MQIVVAQKAGACFGVERALELARRVAAEATGPVHTLGPLIHNPAVVDSLAKSGVTAVEQPEDATPGATLLMRAHGVTPEVEARAAKAGLTCVDATCPYVKKVHVTVERMAREGYVVVVVGEKGHPEVEGTCGHAPESVVVGSAEELVLVPKAKKIGVVAQTTLERRVLREVVSGLIGRCEELRVVDTICEATSERQQAAAELASKADVMLVIGGRGSANTRHLADVCSGRCARTHHVEDASEIEQVWLADAELVGITAGASTPADQIEAVCARVCDLSA